MINMYVMPAKAQDQMRELYFSIREDGISDMLKYLRLYKYHTLRLLDLYDEIKYYRQFDPKEIIDLGEDIPLELTVENELKDLNEKTKEEEIYREKAKAVIEYLESKEAGK